MAKESGQLNWFEKSLAAVSPGMAVNRLESRLKLQQFAASGGGRARGKKARMFDQGSSETWKKQRERLDAIWEARAMEEHFCIIAGMLQRLGMYIGGTLEYQPQTGNAEIDRVYADYFHDWSKRADWSGRLSFGQMATLGVTSAIRDGEHGWARRHEKGELRLQAIEGDRIGNPNDHRTDEKNINGIKIDDRGRVVHYEIYRRTRNATYTKEAELKPGKFMHLFFPHRTDQYHGVSKLAPALPHARDLYELFGHEKIAAKFASSFAALVKMKDPGAPGASDFKENANTGTATLEAKAGTVMRMQQGEEDFEFAPGVTRPSGAFMALVEALIREIALALVLPYGFVYNMAAFGGVTARLETQAALRTIKYYRGRLQDTLLDPVKQEVLMLGIARKEIPFHRDWNKGQWNYGAEITGDVGHQTRADLELIEAGVKPRAALSAEHGYTQRQVFRAKAAELKDLMTISDEEELPLEMLASWLSGSTEMLANQERAKTGEPGPNDPPPPPDGLVGKVGDKGVAQVLNLLKMVSEGAMDRETAVLTLVNVWGMEVGEAEAIVPQAPVGSGSPGLPGAG
jgi:capsid protein